MHSTRRLADVKAEAVVDTLAKMLADVGAKTLSNTLVEVRAEALVNAMGKTLAEVKFQTLSNTLPRPNEVGP